MKAKTNTQPRRRLLNLAVLAALGGGALAPASASAASLYWAGGSCGSAPWDSITYYFFGNPVHVPCWSTTPGGAATIMQPQPGDNAYLTQSDGTNRTVTYQNTAYSAALNRLEIDATGSGTMTLSQTGYALAANNEFIGYYGTGTFNQSGGTNGIGSLLLGYWSSSSGTYNLSGSGSLSAGTEYIGNAGTGTFNQSGGTNGVYNLSLGYNSGSNGTYTLSGGTLNVTGSISNGAGTGTFNLDGGTLNLTGSSIALDTFNIGHAAGSNGSFTLGTGKTLSAGDEYIGNSGTGAFTQSGGTNAVSGGLYIGYGSGNGSYTLNAGSLSANHELIGYIGTGAFTQNGGTHTVTTNLTLGQNSGSSGTYTLGGGALNVGGNIVNGGGSSRLNIDGGSLSVGGGNGSIGVDTLFLGSAVGTSGSHTLSGTGSLSATSEYIGYNGTGAFTQSGGTHSIGDILTLGYSSTGNGSYTLNAGSLSAYGEYIGRGGTGSFTQSGGTHTVGFYGLVLGDSSGSNGSYNLSAGSLSAISEFIGLFGGTGAFTQSGGTNTVTNITLGYSSTGNGSYTLNAGSVTASSETVGGGGTGTFTQNGGTNTVTNSLTLGQYAGSTGSYTLNGGTLTVGSLVKGAGSGSFNFNAGTLNFTGNLALGGGHLLGDAVVLTGVKTLGVTGATTLNGAATLTLDGGTFSTGSLANNGGFAFNSGTFNLTGTNLTIGAGGLFGSSAQFASNQTVNVTNTTTINSGSVLALNNSAFSSGATNNSGQIVLGGAISNLGGGTLNNAGRISGIGQVSATLNNLASGEVRAALGNDMSFTGAGNTNSGRITLLGGSVDSLQGLTNASTGMISGRGTLATGATAATGLTNQGNLALSGTTDIIGDVTNTGAGRIVVSGGATATFYDDVVHNGAEIRVSSGSQAVFFGAVSGAGAYTGTGTVFFEGDLRPGNSPALVSMGGDMTLGMFSHTTMELGGLARGLQYDAFDVTGTLTLDGALDVVLYDMGLGVFAPQAGDSFDLFAASTILGNFSSMSFAALSNPNLFWQIDLLTDAIGTTDVVRLSVASNIVPPPAVPEPETYAMLLAGLGLMGFAGRNRRNRTV